MKIDKGDFYNVDNVYNVDKFYNVANVDNVGNGDVDGEIVVMALSAPKNFRVREKLRRDLAKRTENIDGGEENIGGCRLTDRQAGKETDRLINM